MTELDESADDAAAHIYGQKLAEAAGECRDMADDYKAVALKLQECAAELRRLGEVQVYDPTVGKEKFPDLLRGLLAVNRTQHIASEVDRLTVDVYGRAGVWEAETERYAGVILTARRDVPPHG